MSTPSLSDFDLNLLRTLKVLLDTRHISQAAEQLGLSQPAISRQLGRLRAHFGDPLLVREGIQYLPTPLAERIGQKLPALLNGLDDLIRLEEFSPGTCQRQFIFASSDYIAEHMLPDIIRNITAEAPMVDISYQLWQRGDYSALFNGKADLITTISTDIPAGLHGKILGEDQPVCLMRQSHPAAAYPDLSLADYLASEHLLINGGSDKDSRIDQQLRQMGAVRHIKIDVPFYAAALKLIQQADLFLTVPLHIAINYSKLYPVCWRPIPLADIPPYQYWLLWHDKNHWDSAHRWFRQHVYQVVDQSIHGVNYYLHQQSLP